MRVKPGTTHDLFEEWGVTGATLGVRLDDNQGNTTVARTTGFVESPAGSGIYYLAAFTFPDDAGDYVLIFNDDGTTYAPDHVSTRAVTVTSSAPDDDFDGDTYATVEELLNVLKIRTPTDEQTEKAERALVAAAGEINAEIDLGEDDALAGWQLALAAEVNIDRAVEHWNQKYSPFGLVNLGAELGATPTARDSWERHAMKLAPLKAQWGVA